MLNRREVLLGSAAAGAAMVAACNTRRIGWEYLSQDQAVALAALCDQIVPADDYPSASQAGVVTYIDRQLTGPYRRHRKAYNSGLENAEKLSLSRFAVGLARASREQRLEIARAIEQQDPVFFDLVRRHTLQGFYGSPRHGGNRDAVSWRMLGLDEPPLRGRAQYDLTAGSKS
jgi:gluconate 2-dehydrogenase gamma chain